MPAKILGISAFYHNSAAVLIIGGKTQFASQEERYPLMKNNPAFPANFVIRWYLYIT